MSQTEQRSSDLYSAPRPSDTDYQRLYNAVFGDGFNWDGVVKQLQEIKREVGKLNGDVVELSESVQELVKDVVAVRNEVNAIKDKIGVQPKIDAQTTRLLWVMTIGLGFLVLVALWPVLSKLFA